MKISINFRTSGDLVVEHQGKTLEWRPIKSVEQKEFDIFKEINEYWMSCGIDKQNAIFAAYQEIHAVFAEFLLLGTDMDVVDLLPRLRPKIAKLFEYHKQEDVYKWYRDYSGIGVPSGIPDVFNEAEGRPGTRDQTYDRADYERLIVLSVSIRCVVPVWGEFILRTEGVIGNHLKEYWALTLLRESNIMTSPAMARLRRYIDAMVSRTQIDLGVSLKVTSVHNFNEWMLGLTAVRRLTRGDLRVGNSNTNLAAFIYGFLRMKLEGLAGTIGDVKDKKPISSTGDGENNLSDLEGFRIKQAVPAGDVAIAPEFLRLAMNAVLNDGPYNSVTMPLDFFKDGQPQTRMVELKPFVQLLNPVQFIGPLVKQAFTQTRTLNTEIIENAQLLLCGYLVHDYISIMSIPYMRKTDAQRLIAFCAATMWSYKQYDLACLMMAIYRLPANQDRMVRPSDHRARVSKETSELLKENFPYIRPGRGGKPQDSGVFEAIDKVVNMIKDRDAYYNLPSAWAKEIGVANGTIYHAPVNIRTLLADFILRVNTIPKELPLY